ncbi:hypothetical protein LRH25_09825 [Ideonella azotifigens]|uniref:DNRLRE domain-containing protein n=1 Tax=Ideonella azotifigens TaxID=513160 RepID=A0ABP3VN83_9BURK|nr:hypothetical protein [Ideonella azotifigens]MCD2340642.1 hypothetical protein [Ideonella azotifigens]
MRIPQTLTALLSLLALAAATTATSASAEPIIRRVGPAQSVAPTADAKSQAKADTQVLYSTITSNVAMYKADAGLSIAGDSASDPLQNAAVPFTPAINANLTKMVLPVALGAGNRSTLNIVVYADANGVPGAPLFTWTDVTPFDWKTEKGAIYPCCSYVQVTTAETIALTAGVQYWVGTVTTAGSDVSAIWLNNANGTTGGYATYGTSGSWIKAASATLPALSVYGVAR